MWICASLRGLPQPIVAPKPTPPAPVATEPEPDVELDEAVTPVRAARVSSAGEQSFDAPDVVVPLASDHALDLDPEEDAPLDGVGEPPRGGVSGGVFDGPQDPFLDELQALISACETSPAQSTHAVDVRPPMVAVSALDQELFDELSEPATPVQARHGRPQPAVRRAQPLTALHFELTPSPPQLCVYNELTSVISDHLLSLGHTRAAAIFPLLMNGENVDLSRLGEATVAGLVRDDVACRRGAAVIPTRAFRECVTAFRDEFATAGLNVGDALFWLAQLVVALGAATEPADLEEDLRRLGVAELFERAA